MLLAIAILASNSVPHAAAPAPPQKIGFFISNPCSRCNITIHNSTITQTHSNNTFGTYDNGGYTITATPAAGFLFQIWSGTSALGVSSSTQNPTSLTVYGSGNLTARFAVKINPTSNKTLTCGTSSCAVASNATIAQTLFNSGNHTLIVTFSGPTDTVGFSNITVPKSDVFNSDPTSITVYRNSTKLSSSEVTITSNATDFFVYFTFTFHSGVRAEYVFFPLQSQSLTPYLGVALVLLIAPIVVSARARFKNRRL